MIVIWCCRPVGRGVNTCLLSFQWRSSNANSLLAKLFSSHHCCFWTNHHFSLRLVCCCRNSPSSDADLSAIVGHKHIKPNLKCVWMEIRTGFKLFFPSVSSLGCGIGYGYLHRIPTRPFEEGKKISFPGNSPSEPVSPLKDGFTEVRTHTHHWTHQSYQYSCNYIVHCPKMLLIITLSLFTGYSSELWSLEPAKSSWSVCSVCAWHWKDWSVVCSHASFLILYAAKPTQGQRAVLLITLNCTFGWMWPYLFDSSIFFWTCFTFLSFELFF